MCDKDMAAIVTKIDVGFIRPDDLGPVVLFIATIEACPAHLCMLMELHKEGDLPSNTSMVSSMVEDMSNGDLIDFEPQLISDLRERCPMVFLGFSNDVTFVNIHKLCGTSRTWLVFGCSCHVILFEDVACCAALEYKLMCNFCNILTTKNSTNEEIFCSSRVLRASSFWCRHKNLSYLDERQIKWDKDGSNHHHVTVLPS